MILKNLVKGQPLKPPMDTIGSRLVKRCGNGACRRIIFMDIVKNIPDGGDHYSLPEHARRMERERDEALRKITALRWELRRLLNCVGESEVELIKKVLDEN